MQSSRAGIARMGKHARCTGGRARSKAKSGRWRRLSRHGQHVPTPLAPSLYFLLKAMFSLMNTLGMPACVRSHTMCSLGMASVPEASALLTLGASAHAR